jgi:predicted RND superfamily exporter protein
VVAARSRLAAIDLDAAGGRQLPRLSMFFRPMRWLLTRGRYPYLLLVAAATALLAWQAAGVGIEHDNASMNTRDAAQLADYAEFKSTFGNDEDLLLSLTHPHLLEASGMALIAELTSKIAALDGVRRVYSLTNADQVVAGSLGAEVKPLVAEAPWGPEEPRRLQAALDCNPHLTGVLISPDRKTAGFVVEIDDRPGDDDYRARLIDELRRLPEQVDLGGGELHLTGISVQKLDVGRFVQRDQNVLVPIAAVVLAALLAISFRRVSAVVLPLSVTAVSLAWTMGGYAMAGFELNPVTSLLPPFIMVLSISTSIHLYHGWLAARQVTDDPLAAIASTVRTLAMPCFFTALTTALGLGSLLVSTTPAVRQFGTFAAIGVMLSFLVALTLVPVGLTFIGRRGAGDGVPIHGILDGFLAATARLSTRAPRRILAVATAMTVAACALIPLIRNNTDLVRFLKPSSALRRDTLFIDRHLGGTNLVDFVLERADGRPLTSVDDVHRVARFMDDLSRRPGVTGVYGIVDLLRQIQRAETGSNDLELPPTDDEMNYAFDLVAGDEDRDLIDRFLGPEQRRMRVSMHVHSMGSERTAELVADAVAHGRDILGDDISVRPMGAYYLMVHDSNRLVRSQVSSFALAVALVIPAIGILFRSIKVMLVSLIPNLMPILWTGGVMGAAGIDLSTGTAMIASIVIGLAVDDTIHYVARFRREYRGNCAAAISSTTSATGRALVVASMVLAIGFWVGCFGSFQPTIYFSLLSGATMASALLCDLLVLPACLLILDPDAK